MVVRSSVRMSATIESDESNEVDIINITSCATLLYEKGKKESAFLRKENFGLSCHEKWPPYISLVMDLRDYHHLFVAVCTR